MTSKYETTVGKRDGQWRASTTIPLEGTQRELDIVTSKDGRDNITTRATVFRVEGAFRSHAMGFGSGRGDFSRRVLTSPCRRVTERTVMEVHLKAMEDMDAILQRVKDHYAAQTPHTHMLDEQGHAFAARASLSANDLSGATA